MKRFSGKAGKKAGKGSTVESSASQEESKMGPLAVLLSFKKHVFDPSKRFVQ